MCALLRRITCRSPWRLNVSSPTVQFIYIFRVGCSRFPRFNRVLLKILVTHAGKYFYFCLRVSFSFFFFFLVHFVSGVVERLRIFLHCLRYLAENQTNNALPQVYSSHPVQTMVFLSYRVCGYSDPLCGPKCIDQFNGQRLNYIKLRRKMTEQKSGIVERE